MVNPRPLWVKYSRTGRKAIGNQSFIQSINHSIIKALLSILNALIIFHWRGTITNPLPPPHPPPPPQTEGAYKSSNIDQKTYTSQCLCWYPLQFKFPLSPRIYVLQEGKFGNSEAVRLYICVIGPLLFMTVNFYSYLEPLWWRNNKVFVSYVMSQIILLSVCLKLKKILYIVH